MADQKIIPDFSRAEVQDVATPEQEVAIEKNNREVMDSMMALIESREPSHLGDGMSLRLDVDISKELSRPIADELAQGCDQWWQSNLEEFKRDGVATFSPSLAKECLRWKSLTWRAEKKKKNTALDILDRLDFATEAALIEREKEAKEMVFILPGIAARGQATVIYAEPNSGKTLLTLKIIHDRAQSGELKDLQIYYCNFDDDFRGANQKARYVQHLKNVKMLDNQKASPELILSIIRKSVEDGTASMICFVLDTLIRFVSDSDKNTQREFNKEVQKFIGAQGTIIALGHTNKHKSAEGKAVYGGTSDIRNCFSQSAFLELETEKDATDRRVRFVNDKLRGMSAVSTCYKYSHGDTRNWIERVETVERVDEAEADALVQELTAQQQREQDQPIIDYILSELKTGAKSHSALERNNLVDPATGSKAERVRVLNLYCNENDDPEMRLWGKSKGGNGGWNYYVEESPPEKRKNPWE